MRNAQSTGDTGLSAGTAGRTCGEAGGGAATLAIILPGRLLQFECRANEQASKQGGDPRFCGCLDVSQLGRVLQQRPMATEPAILCIIGR